MEVNEKLNADTTEEVRGPEKCEEISVTAKDPQNTNYRYEDGKCVYTDPNTGGQLEWNEDTQEWKAKENPPGTEYSVVDNTYVYTDKNTNITYKWNKDNSTWEPKPAKSDKVAKEKSSKEDVIEEDEEEDEDDNGQVVSKKKEIKRQDMSKGHYGYENNTHTFTDGTDGTVYLWDKEKNAWFPKVDEDFIAQYQMNYGFVAPSEDVAKDNGTNEEPKVLETVDTNLKRKQPEPPTWFDVDEKNNTKVYVSNLPLDITEQEFVDLMQKCGLVMKDINTGKMKIKLYTEPGSGALKGDGLCTYIKVESVELALKILDGYEFKGKQVSVERAKFTMKGDSYDPSLKPKKKRKKEIEKIKKIQEKLLDWRPDKLRGERSKNERVVIVKNLFHPSIFDKDVELILEYQQDLREECSKCGDVRKVIIYDRHPEGVAQITFKEVEAADACIQLLHNRWFGQRQITAEAWDGKTKYKIIESQAETKKRIETWDKFLEVGDKDKKTKEKDSDQDTRSSAGSDDDTDDENKK